MTPDQLLAFCTFAAIASVTPGPNNMMILASGLNHGFKRSLPHLAGITLGFTFMVFVTGLGLHAVFIEFPVLQTVLKYVGAAYLLWLAWQLARAHGLDNKGVSAKRPMRFISAAAFQWVNPKAWVMAIGAVTTFLPTAFGLADVLLLALVFGIVNAPCVGVWAGFGAGMQRFLRDPRLLRCFNLGTAGLLVLSLYPILKS
ncbi:Threonine/homoserine/homoserine lactone efflux protein [Chitinasiproducens palmae]|uniref:Threonine/homoserine/homoserine lactone efflux protein n=2 Tax=Chitinasiproducens palmae TaxID=1770053 RepID=A0A1H2PKK9_9BURK|nr:Threonine/homoserine/homoserine lactone efflux protein [Chitinasiproducens palmae]